MEDKQLYIARLQEQILEDLRRLPPELPEVQAKDDLITWARSPGFWTQLDLERILRLQQEIAPLMRYRLAEPRNIIKLRLPDQIQARRWITYGPAGEGAFVDQYRAEVEAHIRNLADQEPAFIKLRRQQQLTPAELIELAMLLNKPDLFIREEILQQVYEHSEMNMLDFIRYIIENKTDQLPSRVETIEEAVRQFLMTHPYFTQAQRQFVYAIRSLLVQHARSGTQEQITAERLTELPFKRIGQPKNLFSAQELEELLRFANYQIS